MDNDYITFNNIEATQIDFPFINTKNQGDEEKIFGEEIYQIQPTTRKDKSMIIHVGYMTKISDILIKEFDFKIKYKCHLISKIYNKSIIENLAQDCKFQILK